MSVFAYKMTRRGFSHKVDSNAQVKFINTYPSYFKLYVRWLPLLTPVTYWCKLLGIRAIAAFLQFELFWVT
ncbi:hypothetical protein PEC301645_32240 [Pectobacterium carotovorum subsp. carotovorum]|jgi:hypothetical protein|uniref:Uncharacterized protein n=1 Tax=Pectobacterium carotovorum subsp. carotovorum (strain PC1) TaxID=561230 RepID=C6DHM2_PECCP|nr:hypothetical protein PC1_0161 [Pectobacterium carotovorum subsp. carotovorum PC1]MBG0752702.1 hypothetical protein [Pectobacterium carotovorum subsp. carotovorum PCCS1]GKV95777.1 hypothetical protein PEC301645_32240 [Pectobacterium carotovorum subsp. carotovorum]